MSADVVSAFFRTWGFVTLGVKVAPSHRVETSVALGAIALAVLVFLYGLMLPALANLASDGLWRVVLYALIYLGLWIAGLVWAIRDTQKDADAERRVSALIAELGTKSG